MIGRVALGVSGTGPRRLGGCLGHTLDLPVSRSVPFAYLGGRRLAAVEPSFRRTRSTTGHAGHFSIRSQSGFRPYSLPERFRPCNLVLLGWEGDRSQEVGLEASSMEGSEIGPDAP